jgi:hypothetical protein
MMYKVLVRPVLSYASESWPLSRLDERLLSISERRILRYIFGPVEDDGTWRRRYNHELYKLFNGPDHWVYKGEETRMGWTLNTY